MGVIARLPKGAVVLPGLDTDLDEESWATIGGAGDDETDPVHSHPQASLRRLLDRHLRVPRAAVTVLGEVPEAATSAQPSALGSPAPGGHHRPLVADLSRGSRRA